MPKIGTTRPEACPAPVASAAGRLAGGFTLIELLVVVALIGILAAVVGFSISGGSQGQALGTAQRNLLAMVQAAKANAQLQGTRARLIIFSDKNVVSSNGAGATLINSKVLRFYGVIYALSDDPTATLPPNSPLTNLLAGKKPWQTWIAANQGSYLPDGIYFVPTSASAFALNLPSFAATHNAVTDVTVYPTLTNLDIHPGVTTGQMQIQFPVDYATEDDPAGDYYYFIEFAPDGFYYNNNGNNNIMIGAANSVTDNSVDFGGTGGTNAMFSGVQVRPLTGAALFRSTTDFTSGQ
jgi:prepilin-type N-terminal cleavage/methylation domain-containing protein